MMNNSTLFKAFSGIALASVFSLTSCQKEDFMEEQFQTETEQVNPLHGQAIPGQYIVVFKNGSNKLSATGISSMNMAGRAATNALRERMLLAAGVEREALQQTFEGTVNGFAARLTNEQLNKLRQNPDVAYIEQDRILALARPTKDGDTTTKGGGNKNTDSGTTTKGNGKKTSEPAPTDPIVEEPTPTEPIAEEPAPTEPVVEEPAPSEPIEEPVIEEPASSPYNKITALPGETIPWHIAMNGYGDGTGKTVWVIDSGIDTDHPDLNVDLSRSVSLIYGVSSVEDGYGHGTTVAGIIAAKNNGTGMIGVAANATVIALRVFDDTGYGTMSRAISAVNHVINNGKAGDVVNLSLGGGISSTLDNAVITAANKGILFAIAAGNSAVDCSVNSPARVNAPGVYTVSAMDRYQNFWANSNYGAPVDFIAPGVSVTSTRIGGGIGSGGSGTSYASPHVAGILLLRGEVLSQGIVNGDKDSWPDPIASVE
ncbi:S8 family serine peptidase [uncultured Pontibacter sp.]|uniref:S8 family serine peptidase n=1 Tax=uncultured Pontibacter sp. TaxID=453356 RepID=UPI0026079C28|nr:S8 family serine peptidase [uncultured Pontibacter sp.]